MAPPPARHYQIGVYSGLLLCAALALAAALLGAMGGLGRADQILYDRAVASMPRPAADDIVIVAIDDAAINALGRWPWPRHVHAALLDRLRGARAVGMDLIFSEPDTQSPRDDGQLAEAIRQHRKVVLPVVLDRLPAPGGGEFPLTEFAQAAAGLGYINIAPSADGVVRDVTWLAEVQGRVVPHFTLALLRAGGDAARAQALYEQLKSRPTTHIAFAGPPGHFRTIPYLQVLNGLVAPETFEGKYVLVGSWATGLSDAFPTPVSHQANGMAGVEILANLLQAAREDRLPRRATAWQNAVACAVPVLLLCLGLRRLSPSLSLTLSGLVLAAILAGAYLALRYGQIWFPPSAALLAAALAYPLWSWRSQAAALREMDRELKRLRQDYPPVMEEARIGSRMIGHSLEDRLQELRRALARVRNLRRFLEDGLEGMPDATLVFDAGSHMQFFNRAAQRYMAALRPGALRIGMQADDVLADIVPDEAARAEVGRALLEFEPGMPTDPWNVDMEVQDRAGRYLILKCAPIQTEEGVFAGTVLTLNDISAIRQAERKREETLRFVSHDMRAPQNAILALVDLNREQADIRPDAWNRIGQLAHRTLRLVDDFVHLTRAESVRLAQDDVDLGDTLLQATDDFWAPAQARNIALRVPESVPVAMVRGDQALLLRTLVNLLDNALKYTQAGGEVTVSLDGQDGWWELAIRDNGPGISAADQAELFKPFSRVGTTAKSDIHGAGLGLAFVHTVILRHGGTIRVESEPGHGAAFIIRLPVAAAPEEPPA